MVFHGSHRKVTNTHIILFFIWWILQNQCRTWMFFFCTFLIVQRLRKELINGMLVSRQFQASYSLLHMINLFTNLSIPLFGGIMIDERTQRYFWVISSLASTFYFQGFSLIHVYDSLLDLQNYESRFILFLNINQNSTNRHHFPNCSKSIIIWLVKHEHSFNGLQILNPTTKYTECKLWER